MDPLTSLAIAGNVIQLVDFASRLVSKGVQLYRSEEGALSENIETDLIAHDLTKLSVKLKDSLPVEYELDTLSDDNVELIRLCNGCEAVGKDLTERLNKLKVSGQHRKWKSMRQAIKSVWTKEEINSLAERLKAFRDQLETHILVSLRETVNWMSVQQDLRFANLDESTRDLMAGICENRQVFSRELEYQTIAITKLQREEHEKTRMAITQAMKEAQGLVESRYGKPVHLLSDAALASAETKRKKLLPFFKVQFSASPTFTGRSRILKDIQEYFTSASSDSQQRLALHGLGGAGKTQLALRYARQHFERFRASVFWINASSNETILTEIARLCHVCGLEANSGKEKIEAFKKFLSIDLNPAQWLLIFDNADDLHGIDLPQYFPNGRNGNILVTSRDRSVRDLMTGIEIDEMELEEAKAFLIARASLGELSNDDATLVAEIAADLGCLPLMLDQAAAFILATGVTLSTYLSYVKKKKVEVFKYNRHSAPGLADYQKSVETTWTISFEKIRRRSPDAAQLLLTLAFLDHTLIWEGMLSLACQKYVRAGVESVPSEFPAYLVKLVSDDGYLFNVVMEELLAFSLVRRKQDSITIHPLVGYCARQWTTESEMYTKQTIQLVSEALIYADRTESLKIMPQIYKCCELSKQLEKTRSDISTRLVKICFRGYTLDGNRRILLESSEPFLDRVNQPGLALRHAGWLSVFYSDTYGYNEALLLLENTRKWAEQLQDLTPDLNSNLGDIVIQQADLYTLDGRLKKAENLMKSWRPLNPQSPTPIEAHTLGYRDRLLGRHFYIAKRFGEAERVMRPVLDREPIGGVNRAWTITHLADVYTAQKRFDEVANLIKAELAGLGPDADASTQDYNARLKVNLGEALIELQRYSEARTLLSRVLSDLESLEKTSDRPWIHREMFFVISGLARIEHQTSEWGKAAELWQIALNHARAVGWDRRLRAVSLAHISHEDAIRELGRRQTGNQNTEFLKVTLEVIRNSRETAVEEPMFYHWATFLTEKLERSMKKQEEVSTISGGAEQTQLPSPPGTLTQQSTSGISGRAITQSPWWKFGSRKHR